jgi:hypothetical protein
LLLLRLGVFTVPLILKRTIQRCNRLMSITFDF